mmetsp:Transcript_26062/g.54096  ORF Transcript_26062/g.54096 Transcript_26062/m.54096 type:complete len:270 (-) Transcript_26062:154-963(-)
MCPGLRTGEHLDTLFVVCYPVGQLPANSEAEAAEVEPAHSERPREKEENQQSLKVARCPWPARLKYKLRLQITEQQAEKAGGDKVGQHPEDHMLGLWPRGHDDLEAALHGEVGLEDAPESRIDADPPIWHDDDMAAGFQSTCKGRVRRIVSQQRADVAVLRVGQEAAVQSTSVPRPIHADFPDEFEASLCPGMRGKDVALQAFWMPHKGPALATRSQGGWLDVLLVDLVNGWANLFIAVEGVRKLRIVSNEAFCPQLPDLSPKEVEICF